WHAALATGDYSKNIHHFKIRPREAQEAHPTIKLTAVYSMLTSMAGGTGKESCSGSVGCSATCQGGDCDRHRDEWKGRRSHSAARQQARPCYRRKRIGCEWKRLFPHPRGSRT